MEKKAKKGQKSYQGKDSGNAGNIKKVEGTKNSDGIVSRTAEEGIVSENAEAIREMDSELEEMKSAITLEAAEPEESGKEITAPVEAEEPVKEEALKKEPAKEEALKKGPAEEESTKKELAKEEPTEKEPAKEEPTEKEPAKEETTKKELAKEGPIRKKPVKKEVLKGEPIEKESIKEEPETEEPESEEPPKKGKKKKIAIIAGAFALILVGAVSFIYYKGMVYYRTHFLPNTAINGIDCAEMEVDSIVALLDAPIYEYKLEVSGRDYKSGNSGAKLGEIVPGDIGLTYTGTREAVESFLEEQDEYKWFFNYFGGASDYHMERGVGFDGSLLQAVVEEWDACKKGNMRKAEDAYISGYSEELHGYEIIPETSGTELDVDKVTELIGEAIMKLDRTLDVEEQGCYREASVRRNDEKLTDAVDEANKWLGTEITYDWNGTEVILDYETLKDWVSIENNSVILDEEQAKAFVKAQASAHDTYGKKKNFVTTLGVELTLSRRSYGWKTDVEGETAELLDLIRQGSVADREPIYGITAKKKGTNDIGNSYVEADLTNQHLYLYQDGVIVLETDFVSGTMNSSYDCVTPEGIFGLTYKTTNAVLRGATYTTPVSYWMPFYGNYGMHDANWRGAFGGEIYKTNGSHGCINLPPSMAAQIYPYVSTGFPVICYYYDGVPYVGPPAEPVAPIDESTPWVDPEEE